MQKYSAVTPSALAILIKESISTRLLSLRIKEYIVVGVFGESRDTDDINGNILKVADKKNILSFDELENIIKKNFHGNIIQKPPIFSAKRINGKRAYNMARENIDFEIKSVNVRVNDIELLD